MPLKKLYNYKARDLKGIAVSGQVEAESIKVVSHSLKELGYVIVSIEDAGSRKARLFADIKARFFAVTEADILIFLRQVAAMIKAGLPLLNSLSNVIDQTSNLHFKKIIINIASDIRGGKSFSEALSVYPRLFSPFHINMIKAGETGGMMPEVLERLATVGYEEQELKGKIKGALAYPILLIILSILIVTALLIFILPKFISIFEESGTKLPFPTVILLFISSSLRSFWYIPLAAIMLIIFLIRCRKQTEKGRYYLHQKMLTFPLFGRLLLIVSVSRFCKIMGALTKSGIPLLNALAVSQGLLDNQVLNNAVGHVRQAVTGGVSLSESLKVSGAFPSMMVQMLAVGESTGKLDEMFLNIGDFYDKESALIIRTMTTLIEPILLLFMGVIVGFIALSVLLPVFNLVKVLKR